jgi:hypothetical protein
LLILTKILIHHLKWHLRPFPPKSHNSIAGARPYGKHIKKLWNSIMELLHDGVGGVELKKLE